MKLRAFDVGNKRIQPFVVEAQAVDQRLLLGDAKHARLGVAALAQRRDGADFDKAKAHRIPSVDAARIFIQACGQAHAIGEGQACQSDRVTDTFLCVGHLQRRALRGSQGANREVMRRFGIEAKQKRTSKRIGNQGHGVK
jgi:hypothetical protein